MMLRARSRAVAKQTLAADHRSHPQPPPSQNLHHHHHNPPPFSLFLSRFRQFAAGTRCPTPSSSSVQGRRRSWELESDARGISLVVSAGRSKLVLFGPEVGVRTRDPDRPDFPVSSQKKKTLRIRESFLSSCYTCKKIIEPTADIYIYRGEKAFCSWECRHREIVQDKARNLDDDDDDVV